MITEQNVANIRTQLGDLIQDIHTLEMNTNDTTARLLLANAQIDLSRVFENVKTARTCEFRFGAEPSPEEKYVDHARKVLRVKGLEPI